MPEDLRGGAFSMHQQNYVQLNLKLVGGWLIFGFVYWVQQSTRRKIKSVKVIMKDIGWQSHNLTTHNFFLRNHFSFFMIVWYLVHCCDDIILQMCLYKYEENGSKQDAFWKQGELPLLVPNGSLSQVWPNN